MTKYRPALITQAEVKRAIRAARQEGVTQLEIRPNGSIVFQLSENVEEKTKAAEVENVFGKM